VQQVGDARPAPDLVEVLIGVLLERGPRELPGRVRAEPRVGRERDQDEQVLVPRWRAVPGSVAEVRET
jgi:hypothetical protein